MLCKKISIAMTAEIR